MKTYTIEVDRPDGRVITYGGCRMVHRDRARKLRQRGTTVWSIAPGVYVWQPATVNAWFEVDDRDREPNRAEIAFTPETSFGAH